MSALNMGRPSIEDIKDYSQHIAQNTYLWTDGLQSYSALSTDKQCTIKQMKDRKQYKRYRSAASKYINRYAALFRIQELYRKINVQEMITSLLMKLRHLHTTFFIRQIRNEGRVCQEKCVSFFVSFFTSVNLFCYLQIYHHHF